MKKLVIALCVALAGAAALSAQMQRPKAAVRGIVERPAAPAGSPVRLALKVSLPESLHTQSNKPLDSTLIPTVLTIDAPAGVTVDEIVYPPAVDVEAGRASISRCWCSSTSSW